MADNSSDPFNGTRPTVASPFTSGYPFTTWNTRVMCGTVVNSAAYAYPSQLSSYPRACIVPTFLIVSNGWDSPLMVNADYTSRLAVTAHGGAVQIVLNAGLVPVAGATAVLQTNWGSYTCNPGPCWWCGVVASGIFKVSV